MALLGGRAAAVVVAAATALVLAVAPAWASLTVWVTDGDLEIRGNAAPDDITVTCTAGEVDVPGTSPGLACADLTSLAVFPRGGPDTVDLSAVTTAVFPQLGDVLVEVADSSADVVTGTALRDEVTADGEDTVDAGPGDDWVEGAEVASGGPGDDTLRGITSEVDAGPGDDRIVAPGDQLIDGGEGFDTVVFDYSSLSASGPMTLLISDAALQPSPGFGPATAGIEEYDLTSGDGAQADVVDSRAFSGRVDVRLRAGDDVFAGGPGADVVDAGSGNDSIDPGTADDVVHAGAGDDVIWARDGFVDVIDCGEGNDSVTLDRGDVFLACENVSVPAPETGAIVGPKRVMKPARALFAFASTVPGAAFECQVDAKPLRQCTSPFKVRTRKLRPGAHTLTVRAVQPAGNADPTPSSVVFKVKKKKHRQA